MTEEFLHHVWKFRLFDAQELRTTDGEPIEILHPGDHNLDSGPDFFNSRLKVGGTLWAGNVEVHISASDWEKHYHQDDKAYDNIILHVVAKSDKELYRRSGEVIPTLEIGERIPGKLYFNYLEFKLSKDWVPCARQIREVPALVINGALDRMVSDRLEQKATEVLNSLALNNCNWEESFYRQLARNFGFKTNAEPFELLAKSLPHILLGRHKNSLFQLEALLYGQAGMLEAHLTDRYSLQLQNEYAFLRKKYRLQAMEAHLWKFLRLRPVNFPSIRIAQFAALIHRSHNLFSKVLEIEHPDELFELMNVRASDYWEGHFMFDCPSNAREKKLGREAINNILINTVVPFLFVYGKQKGNEFYCDRALALLEGAMGENNRVTREWARLGMPVDTAYRTQALIQLKSRYCDRKICLQCSIGNYLIKNA